MIKQTWNIDDSERVRILQLHENATNNLYIIKEQIESKKTINFGDTFASGQSELTPKFQSSVSTKVKEIAEFIKGQKLKSADIIIQPGESRVTNQPPFSTVGSLAIARANSIMNYLNRVLPNLLSFTPNITVREPIIGTTPYVKGNDKNDPRYRAEQFVNVIVDTTIKNNPTPEPYKRESDIGESIFFNNYLIGLISQPMVNTTDVKNPGFEKLNYQNLIFTEVKKDTLPFQIVAKYEIPWQWWNKDRDYATTNTISQNDLTKIRSFKKLS
jgi:hypothetical protein